MDGCKCFYWNTNYDVYTTPELQPFTLPSPIPQWPQGQGFGTGVICLGQLEVIQITNFENVWSCNSSKDKKNCATFYKPVDIPDGFFSLGHYSQSHDQPLHGFVLVAREVSALKTGKNFHHVTESPALTKPLDYTLACSTDDWGDGNHYGCGYLWLPQPAEGYKPMGYLVSSSPEKPSLEEVRCVREDLTEKCETCNLILHMDLKSVKFPFRVWETRPCRRGMMEKGVSVGTFFCSSCWSSADEIDIACLKNLDPTLHAMPNIEQVHALIKHYGPTVFFHPDEIYLPSSLSWFFKNGALLYKKGDLVGVSIDPMGLNLPCGGSNDKEYWIDLPKDGNRNFVKLGNLESAELYVHVKPALGGTFTDIVMWVFCPFNGPATLKIGVLNVALSKVGGHVCDWEHYTLRISNFTGELRSIYFSQHSGGEWVNACNLEFIEGNKAIVYSSKNGHASFPHPGNFLQGSLCIGVRNDAAKSKFDVDSSLKYEVVAAEYLGDNTIVREPNWLQYMREWGPKLVYDGRSELDKLIHLLPIFIRQSVENLVNKFPAELCGEAGPTGPKEKNNWFGDERW
ncbi:uncharacterized protein LOC113304359 isoform X2 [Papaver somniferum]|uniref:uncharacterized protein LOC113304359 isoform X2 n=1 Tax=Papaver somniferum TaxID=3469 RepID=UPI000E70142D|nr:uncharacterized protein LOC113304359 isoform X2 [Papaver somniferum]